MKAGDGTDILIRQIRVNISDIQDFLADLKRIGKIYQCVLICFNRQVMAGRRHVLSAVMHAERAFTEGQAISRSLEVESLLYAAGTRQTGLIGSFGIHIGMNECYLGIVPGTSEVCHELVGKIEEADDEDWETMDPEKEQHLCALFGITDAELAITGRERMRDLVLERVALLAVNR
jgi:KEOPS complex subunit Cgi121